MIPEPGVRQHPATLQHSAQVVAHAHLAHELLRPGGDPDLEVTHAGFHHQLSQLGIRVVGTDVSGPADAGQPFGLDRPQQLLGVLDIAARRDELGIGEPETAHTWS